MEQRDLESRVSFEESRNQLFDVRADAARSRIEELVDVERDRRHRYSWWRDASTHVTPSGPTVAAWSVAGGTSSLSPGPRAISPVLVWNTMLPEAQYRTLWYSWACHPYSSLGAFDHHRGFVRPSSRSRASRFSWLGTASRRSLLVAPMRIG